FKYIGEKIREFESTDEEYVFGGEESYGYLIETEARDKDAVSAAAVTVEMAACCMSKGSSLLEYLDELYRRHGYFEESLVSKTFEGEEGKKKMDGLMNNLRLKPPETVGGRRVVEIRDYLDGSIRRGGQVEKNVINLPRSNVLQFVLEDTIFSARPSGTEPKIKFYVSSWAEPGMELAAARKKVGTTIARVKEEIDRLSG
ncbi:MAG: phospho-sugar mutase, partial [Spirochaetales bacterium]|nr:phospho-sugar mutase [Spirochaetales bacterium]